MHAGIAFCLRCDPVEVVLAWTRLQDLLSARPLCPLKEDSVIQTGREPLSRTHEDFMDGCNAKPVNGTV